jgi:proteasome lid subunit RPN8/RPN11
MWTESSYSGSRSVFVHSHCVGPPTPSLDDVAWAKRKPERNPFAIFAVELGLLAGWTSSVESVPVLIVA